MDPNHELDITDTVFESYEIGTLIGELPQRFDRDPTVRSVVVHNAQRRRSAHRTHMSNQTTFGCLCKIRRKEQQAVSPRGLRISCQLNRDGCGHSSGCKHWYPAPSSHRLRLGPPGPPPRALTRKILLIHRQRTDRPRRILTAMTDDFDTHAHQIPNLS